MKDGAFPATRSRHVAWGALLAACLTLSVGAGGQQTPPATEVDVARLGPQVNQPVPEFTLPDQSGTPRSLKALLGPKGALLVFSRSAGW